MSENNVTTSSGLKIEFLTDDDEDDAFASGLREQQQGMAAPATPPHGKKGAAARTAKTTTSLSASAAGKENVALPPCTRTRHPASHGTPLANMKFDFRYDPRRVSPGSLRGAPEDAEHAAACKAKGNVLYKQQQWMPAVELYREALGYCPRNELHRANKAVYHSNCAACFLQLHDYEQVLAECSAAIDFNPRFVKAFMRRSKANEKLDRQEAALEDVKAAAAIDPSYPGVLVEQQRLAREVHEKQEKMKEEVMGKLKDLGNMVLGKFGMSLDNFKMEQQPGGGYSVNFTQ